MSKTAHTLGAEVGGSCRSVEFTGECNVRNRIKSENIEGLEDQKRKYQKPKREGGAFASIDDVGKEAEV